MVADYAKAYLDVMLSYPQLRDMLSAGIQIGAHTRSHPSLPALSASKAEEEIQQAARAVDEVLAGIAGRKATS